MLLSYSIDITRPFRKSYLIFNGLNKCVANLYALRTIVSVDVSESTVVLDIFEILDDVINNLRGEWVRMG